MAKTPDPIQELVTAARRKQILDAATQVFAEKGFHRASAYPCCGRMRRSSRRSCQKC